MDRLNQYLSKQKILIASYTHIQDGQPTTIGGSGLALCEYLKTRASELKCIWQPMPLSDTISAIMESYQGGKLVKKRILPVPNWPLGRKKAISLIYLLLKIRDIFSVFYFTLFSRRKYDIFIGVEGLDASLGVILKKIGKVKKVIYFNLDYGTHRFPNYILNSAFHALDKFAAYNSDHTWCLSQAMVEGRKKMGLDEKRLSPQTVVPIGIYFHRIQRLPIEAICRKCIVYLGLLSEHQGVQLIFEALPDLIKAVPDIKLIVIGSGPLREKLEATAKENNLEKYVEFTGLISDKEVEETLCRCAIGLAPYLDDPNSNKKFTEPTKPKTYVSCGLPVIITNVPPSAREMKKEGAAMVINYDKNELTQAVKTLLTDDKLYNEHRKKTIEYASKYDWGNIFDKAFGTLLKEAGS